MPLDDRWLAGVQVYARRERIIGQGDLHSFLYHLIAVDEVILRRLLKEGEYLDRIIHTRSCVTWSSMTAWGSDVSSTSVNTWTERFTLVLAPLDRRWERRADVCTTYRLILERNHTDLFLWYAVIDADLWSMCALKESEYLNTTRKTHSCVTRSSLTTWRSIVTKKAVNSCT